MPLQTNIMEIGRLCKARLAKLEVVASESQILFSARKADLPHIIGKMDIVIRPRRQQDIKSFELGGQRYGMILIRTIDFIMRTSYAATEASSDEAWLEQHIPLEDAVLNALAGQMLVDNDSNDYLTCPIHYLGSTEEQSGENDPTRLLWGNSVHSFEFHFLPKLDLSQIS